MKNRSLIIPDPDYDDESSTPVSALPMFTYFTETNYEEIFNGTTSYEPFSDYNSSYSHACENSQHIFVRE